ncbi:hypothetical protein SM033_00274 [Vibrio phage vB_VpaM_sm033]|nr:hypothetical protein SM033_00274 [Vibrio phage vB_VpaM_sm033]
MFKLFKRIKDAIVNFVSSIFGKKEEAKQETVQEETVSPEVQQSIEEFESKVDLPEKSNNGLDYVAKEFRHYLGRHATHDIRNIEDIQRVWFARGVKIEQVKKRMLGLRNVFNMKVIESLTTGAEECLGRDGIDTIEKHAMSIETGYRKALKNLLKNSVKHMPSYFAKKHKNQIAKIINDITATSYVPAN